MLRPDDSVELIPGVGKAMALKLSTLGIRTIEDLLLYAPIRYEDYSRVASVASLTDGASVRVHGTIQKIHTRRAQHRRMSVTDAMLADGTGILELTWFNQPYVENYLHEGDVVTVAGTVSVRKGHIQMVSPRYAVGEALPPEGHGVIPIYSAAGDMPQGPLRRAIGRCLATADAVDDWLPESVRSTESLCSIGEALRGLHEPATMDDTLRARERLAFDELCVVQARSFLARRELSRVRAPRIAAAKKDIDALIRSLPYELTDDQRTAVGEVLADLEKGIPMNRMLEGDVGSGKTVVAAIAMRAAAAAGLQSVMLAPTEILARQHFSTLSRVYADTGVRVALLTQGAVEMTGTGGISRAELLAAIGEGNADVVVGTHALIQEKVSYKTIGLVVVDEQHRFGVKQRAALKEKNPDDLVPHFLSMTATPIPRSLALIVYGELDLSLLRQLPSGRMPVQTKVISERGRATAYAFIDQQLAAGRQAFVICPLIDPSDALGVASATDVYDYLRKKIFPKRRVGLLHGRLKSDEKAEVMRRFERGDLDILVSTSVIEVGIDIPNATVMAVEGAERFGLAQLHQFRGRVGRGAHQSYCILLCTDPEASSVERLRTLERTTDGFEVAERDLQDRGPGDVFGVRQSGIPDLRFARITDTALVRRAAAVMQQLLEQHDIAEFPVLADRVLHGPKETHFE